MTDIERRFRHKLAELELISHGSTQAWNPSGGHSGEPDDRIVAQVAGLPRSPTHPDQPPHLRYLALWRLAQSDDERERLIAAAGRELVSITRSQSTVVSVIDDREILKDNVLAAKGWTDGEVAVRWRCTVREVRRIRNAASLNDRGFAHVIDGDQVQRARGMAEVGMTERQIAISLGLSSASRVRQLLGKAA